MKFEHLIEINDPLNPLIDPLSVDQLWRGLVLRAESPKLFVRFEYVDAHDAATDAANAMYDEFRRSAYQESDIDTIRVLRDLAANGRLDAVLN